MNEVTQPIQDFNPAQRHFEAPAPILPRLAAWFFPPVYTLGLDLSHWNAIADFVQIKAAGYEFVILKATEQTGFIDPTFEPRWKMALDAGLIVGSYHFLRCNYGGINQADHYLETIRPLLDTSPARLVACDVETTDGMTTQSRQTCINKWFGMVKCALGITPLCYSSPYCWQMITENMTLDCVGWVAHWTPALAPSWPNGWPVNKRLFWQYGVYPKHAWVAPVPGVSGECDVNRFYGSLADLRAFVDIHELTTEEQHKILWDAHPELHKP